ncbi:helitron_like_N domain-containing protein [Trichonephila clavipes]|nr:helitron_like_N domain-containing protein [Trichonephila clavipes]
MQCQERKRINATEWINDGASTSAVGAVEIASILTPGSVSIDCVRWSFMKTHWAATSARFTTTFVYNPFISVRSYVGCDAIYVPGDMDRMVQQLPRQLDEREDQVFNVNIKNMSELRGHKISVVAANAIGDDPIEHPQCDRSALESEVLLVRQNLAVSETRMEDSLPVNVPGFDLRSSYNTTKRRQIATTSSVVVSSSNRKAGGVTIYRNINNFTDCNRFNIDISEINLVMKDAEAGDVCLVNDIFKFILGSVHPFAHSVSRN